MKHLIKIIGLYIILVAHAIAASEKLPDQIVNEIVFSMIKDREIAELRPVRLLDMENILKKEVRIARTGLLDAKGDFVIVSYSLKGKKDALGATPYGLDMLVRRKGRDLKSLDDFIVVNVRLVYLAPSGAVYFNYGDNEVWPIERRNRRAGEAGGAIWGDGDGVSLRLP